jgi:hypothetical protein
MANPNETILNDLGLDANKPVTVCRGEDITVILQGESNVFGGADLQLRAALYLIGSIDFKFQEESDPYIRDKTYITLIDQIGALLKANSDMKAMNIEVAKQFIESFIEDNSHKSKVFKDLLDQEEACD